MDSEEMKAWLEKAARLRMQLNVLEERIAMHLGQVPGKLLPKAMKRKKQ